MTKKTILLVDDEVAIRAVLAAVLAREGYHVLEAGDGQEARDYLHATSVDLIITDIIMPDVDGIQFIQEMAAGNNRTPIIAISGGGMIPAEAYLKMAKLSGAKKVFTKPFDNEKFLESVRQLLAPGSK